MLLKDEKKSNDQQNNTKDLINHDEKVAENHNIKYLVEEKPAEF